MDDPDFFKAGNSIADAIGEATKRLSSAQRTVLIGAVAAWIDKVVADEREACAELAEGATAYTQFQTVEHYKIASVIASAIRTRSNV